MRRIPAHAPLARWEQTLQWVLFLFILVVNWRAAWLQHEHDPYEFLRRGTDSLGYYQWLPCTFLEWDWSRMYWTHMQDNGPWISLFTLGVAVLELPFFLLGQWGAWAFGYEQNGFSSPYGVAIMLGTSFYAAAGCAITFRLARRFSSAAPALIATGLLYGATNLNYYSVHEPMMSHVHSFFLIALYAYCALRVLDGPRAIHVVALVLSASLIVLIRQLNVFSLLFPLLLGGWEPVRILFRNMLRHKPAFFGALAVALVPWVLQMMYWRYTTGSLITFTYGHKDEHFHFDKMVPGLVLFSVRNGWLIYTPLMVPVLVMLCKRAWQGVAPARTILLLVCITWLLYSAWWCWWLGTSYGHRGFVDLYAFLAIPLAWVVQAVLKRPVLWKLVAAGLAYALVKLNLGLADRFNWYWSWHEWTWKHLFEQVSGLVTGA